MTVNGRWTEWQIPEELMCGISDLQYEVTRSCTNPSPQNGGDICEGSETETRMKDKCIPGDPDHMI